MNKKNVIYILLIILIIGIFYYQREDDESSSIDAIDLSSQPIYQSNKMLTTIYDPVGNLSYKIIAVEAKHFEKSSETWFSAPNITLYNQQNTATWHIQAKTATLTHDKLLFLNQHVQLDNLLTDSQLKRITTDNAKVDLTTQLVTSEDQVTIQGPSFTSTGTGLLGNLRNKTADILENVKTYYNTPNIQTNNTAN